MEITTEEAAHLANHYFSEASVLIREAMNPAASEKALGNLNAATNAIDRGKGWLAHSQELQRQWDERKRIPVY